MSSSVRVVRTATGDHDVVDGPGQSGEELFDAIEIGGVEGLAPGARRPRRAASRSRSGSRAVEHDVGAVRSREASGFEPDARAAADHDDGLAEQVLLRRASAARVVSVMIPPS